MICCSCGKEIDINYGREYWNGIYCKKCADEMLSTPEYIKNYKRIIAALQAENAAMRERLEKAVGLQYAVGNEVFIVVGDEQRELEIKKAIIEQYFIDDMLFSKKFSVKVFLQIGHTKYIEYVELLKSRWFLSYEEAEARLKELKGGKE